MPELPIATGFYEDSSRPVAAQECANWIPQVPQTNALSTAVLKGTPGLKQFATIGTKLCRGMYVMNEIAYSINGNNLYRINSDGTTTDLGTITGSGRVSIADNGTQICIVVPGSTGYIYTVAGGLVTITDTDFTTTLGPSEKVVFKDSYFIHYNNSASVSTGKIFFISSLNDGTAYDPLDFGTAEIDPDKITDIHVNRNILYVGGTITLEPFQNIGGAGFPFQRIPGAVIQKGIRATFATIDADNTFYFVGGGLNEQSAIWRFSGNNAQKISTAAIDNIIQQSTDSEIKAIFTTTYSEDGGFFVNFHFRDSTFTYDAAASALMQKPTWHERKSKDNEQRLTTWRVNNIIDAYGVTLVGDDRSGTIGQLDRNTYTEYGVSINRVVSTMPFYGEGRRVTVSEIETILESGTALTEEQRNVFPFIFPIIFGDTTLVPGADPHISREYSDDGGFTFGNGTARSLGKQGEYNKRQIWRQEGQFENTRVYRFIVDEPIKATFIKLRGEFL